MDKWKDLELEKMKAGGNGRARTFFEAQPDFRLNWGFQEKWNSKAAALYRDKIATLAEGRDWDPKQSSARNWVPFGGGGGGGMKTSYSYASAEAMADDDYRLAGKDISYQKDDYFGDHRIRSGDRYQGFGSNPVESKSKKDELYDSTLNSLSYGWSALSRSALTAVSYAKDSAVKVSQTATVKAAELTETVSEKMKDGTLLGDVQSSVGQFATKAADYSMKGWQDIQSAFGQPNKTTLNTMDGNPGEKSSLLGPDAATKGRSTKDSKKNMLDSSGGSQDLEWGSWGDASSHSHHHGGSTSPTGAYGNIKPYQDYNEAEASSYGSNSFTASGEEGVVPSPRLQQQQTGGGSRGAKNSTPRPQSGVARDRPAPGAHKSGGHGHTPRIPKPEQGAKTSPAKSAGDDLLIDFGDVKSQTTKSDWDDSAWEILNK